MIFCGAAVWAVGGHALADDAAGVLPAAQRIAGRDFPSVFEAWSPADNLPNEDRWTTLARHDLAIFSIGALGLRWAQAPDGLGVSFTSRSIADARAKRALLLKKNPHLILLAEIRYHDAPPRYLPADSPWWVRGKDGKVEMGWKEGGYPAIDYANPQFQEQMAKQALAAVRSGVYDGIMMDWWRDDDDRLAIVRTIRKAIGDKPLIIVNTNEQIAPKTAPYINGCYMECLRSATPKDWDRIGTTLRWAEKHYRSPRVDCVETWYHKSRGDLNLMRAVTTLALTESDGYCLFGDPDPLPTTDHLHNCYPFWNKSLGKAVRLGVLQPDKTWRREFANGTAVYNPMGNAPATVRFPQARTSLATGDSGKVFTVAPCDGDIFLAQSSH